MIHDNFPQVIGREARGGSLRYDRIVLTMHYLLDDFPHRGLQQLVRHHDLLTDLAKSPQSGRD